MRKHSRPWFILNVLPPLLRRGSSGAEISGKFYGPKIIKDKQYKPKIERKSRVLQNIDITYPSNESKQSMKKGFRKLPSILKSQNNNESALNKKRISRMNDKLGSDADINKHSDSDVLASDPRSTSVRHDLTLDIGNGTNRFSKRVSLLEAGDKMIGNKCQNVPDGPGKHGDYETFFMLNSAETEVYPAHTSGKHVRIMKTPLHPNFI